MCKAVSIGILTALALPVQVFATAPVSSGDLEFPAETAAIVEATAAFFDAIEAELPEKPSADTPIISLPGLLSPATLDLEDHSREFLPERGPVAHLTGYRINWYPVDRMVGAVDFMGTWEGNRNLVCGFLLWDLTDPALPTLDSVVANYVDLEELSTGSHSEAHAALLDANCAYGEIDANFTVFAAE